MKSAMILSILLACLVLTGCTAKKTPEAAPQSAEITRAELVPQTGTTEAVPDAYLTHPIVRARSHAWTTTLWTMSAAKRRSPRLRRLFPRLRHGTAAEGWIDSAVSFWERNMERYYNCNA